MASLQKINGNYYAYFYDRHRTPKRKSYPLRVSLKSTAKKKLHRLEEEYAEGTFDPWNPGQRHAEQMSVSQAIERFLDAKSHLRQRTRETYEELLTRWTQALSPNLMLQDVSAEHLRPFVHDTSVSRASQRKRYRHVRVFLNWATGEGLIDCSPLEDVRQPKKEKKEATFLSPVELERLLICIDVHYEQTEDAAGRKPDVAWLKDMIQVGVCTGLRRQELLALRWSDVDLENGFLRVANRGKHRTKSGHERSVPLAGEALEVLQRLSEEHEDEQDRPVFTDHRGLPIKPDRVSKRFKFFVRKAKLKDRERIRFHSLRHTCGSWLAMKGVPMRVIQAILGHSSVSVTERYSHLQPEVMTKAMQETFGAQ